jgi:hypothetical protein
MLVWAVNMDSWNPPSRSAMAVNAALLTAVISAGCGTEGDGGVLFFAQNERPTSAMEALFEGRVIADSEGCLRLDGPDGQTVVWPFRSELDGDQVLDEQGDVIGQIDGDFALGGGEVEVHDGLPISAADRGRIRSRCAGMIWLVGDVPAR